MVRPPDSLQGQVPQVLYDWLKDLYNDYAQLQSQVRQAGSDVAILDGASTGADDSGGTGYKLIRVPN